MRILFMGTPEPAALCLQALIDAQEQIVAVVSQPDRKKGRGLELTASPTKLLAQKYKIDVLTPEKVKDQVFIDQIRSYNPELIVVVAYGKILPKEILDIPKLRTINVHASLLPKYRGAAPVQWAIFNGETKTGISIMYLDETLDTGDIILQQEVLIDKDDNSETLLKKLFIEGSALLLKAIEQIKNKTAKRIPQNNREATYASIITKEAGEIDWRKTATEIDNQIRAFVPWPVAHTFYRGKMLKIWEAEISTKEDIKVPGEVTVNKENVRVACLDSTLILKAIQYEGGKRITPLEFSRGHGLTSKMVLPS